MSPKKWGKKLFLESWQCSAKLAGNLETLCILTTHPEARKAADAVHELRAKLHGLRLVMDGMEGTTRMDPPVIARTTPTPRVVCYHAKPEDPALCESGTSGPFLTMRVDLVTCKLCQALYEAARHQQRHDKVCHIFNECMDFAGVERREDLLPMVKALHGLRCVVATLVNSASAAPSFSAAASSMMDALCNPDSPLRVALKEAKSC